MPGAPLNIEKPTSFDADECATLGRLASVIQESGHSETERFLGMIQDQFDRVSKVHEAVEAYPPIFGEVSLGGRKRGLDTLVDQLAGTDEGSVVVWLPTRAIVGRAQVLAELNAWRLMNYLAQEVAPENEDLVEEIDHWMHGCVYTRVAEDILQGLAMDETVPLEIRKEAVSSLCAFWESRHLYGARHFFPLLAATWAARRRIRVCVGTLLGVSEIIRLLQAGGDPEFVGHFAKNTLTEDEQQAFQEFLIGVSTEKIQSIAQLMEESGKSSITPEEAGIDQLDQKGLENQPECLRFYAFFRSRHLQASARRIRQLPGPKRTAEEYVMSYFLKSKESDAGTAGS